MPLDPAVFAARREAYMTAIGPGAVAVVRSLPERLRNGTFYHRYRQHSDLIYLTGFVEPETTLVLRPGAETERVVMFVRPRDPEMETWDGRRVGLDGAKERYGADVAYTNQELSARLWDLIGDHEELHYSLGLDEHMDREIASAIEKLRRSEKRGKRSPRAVVDPRTSLHELRLVKRPEELALLRKACAITAEAHVAGMRVGRPGSWEYQIEAEIDYTFRKSGGNGPGYNSIVGAGENALILHYVENDCQVKDGDVVLVDAGCEYEYYTGDITRSWPANGAFTRGQRELYDTVLEVQFALCERVKPGVSITDLYNFSVRALTEGMIRLGLLDGEVDARIEDKSFRRYYMHGISHWLGLDIHDVGAYTRAVGEPRPLVPNMVITIEPGLYIPTDERRRPDLAGVGIRIEDDVAVTADGREILTADCPKTAEDIERVCRR